MRLSLSLTILLPLLAHSAAAQAFFTADGPVQLVTHKNFNKEVVQIEKPVLAMFFAHWCGHCRSAAPEFLKAARSLDGIVKFAAIDCDMDSNQAKCAEYDVKGYPTIKLFPATKRRVARDYQGERKAQAFLDYAVEQLPLSAKKLQATELKPYVEKDPTRPKVILLSTKTSSSPMFRSLALDFRSSHSFAYLRATDDPMHSPIFEAVRAHLGLSNLRSEANLPALVLVKAGSSFSPDLVERYEGQIKYRQVKEWLDSHHNSTSSSSTPPKASKSVKAKAKKAKAPSSSKAVTEEDVPVGGTIEWRAQNVDESQGAAADRLMKKAKDAAAKLAEDSSNLASDAASSVSGAAAKVASKVASATSNVVSAATDAASSAAEAATKVSSKVASASSNVASAVADAASSASDAGTKASSKVSSAATEAASSASSASTKASSKVSSAATEAASSASSASTKASSKVSSAAAEAASSASSASTKASSKVSEAASSASTKVASAATDASTAAEPIAFKVAAKVSETVEQVSDTLNNAAQKVVDAASAATDSVKGNKKKDDIPFDSVEDVIMSSNADHLLDSLASYLGEVTPGGAEAWKKEFGAQVEQARQAARDAILNAPNKEAAQQIALGAEKWLLEAVKFDEEKLGRGEDSTEDEFEGQLKLSIEQKKKLNEMGKTLRKRIASREAALKKKEKAEKKKEKTHDEL
ncbi:hypothetical protein CF327_g5799 [Tilletia walkeri]|nr:hypothetical protein CF327_g5799 [Tilletia walkeri]